jgi:hypothetical protein
MLTKEQFNSRIPHLSAIYDRYADNSHLITVDDRMAYKNQLSNKFESIPMYVDFVDRDIDCKEMVKIITEINELHISSQYNHPNPNLYGYDTEEAKQFNLMARAVHDWVHYDNDYLPCTAYQEYKCWLKQSEGLEEKFKCILFSEIVLQAAYCEHNGRFAPLTSGGFQKLVLIDYNEALN